MIDLSTDTDEGSECYGRSKRNTDGFYDRTLHSLKDRAKGAVHGVLIGEAFPASRGPLNTLLANPVGAYDAYKPLPLFGDQATEYYREFAIVHHPEIVKGWTVEGRDIKALLPGTFGFHGSTMLAVAQSMIDNNSQYDSKRALGNFWDYMVDGKFSSAWNTEVEILEKPVRDGQAFANQLDTQFESAMYTWGGPIDKHDGIEPYSKLNAAQRNRMRRFPKYKKKPENGTKMDDEEERAAIQAFVDRLWSRPFEDSDEAMNYHSKQSRDHARGNGFLARLVSIAILVHKEPVKIAVEHTKLTHPTPGCTELAVSYVNAIQAAMGHETKERIAETIANTTFSDDLVRGRFEQWKTYNDWKKVAPEGDPKSNSSCSTLERVYHAFFNTDSFEEGIMTILQNPSADFPGDCAVFGGLAGAIYGFKVISKKWRVDGIDQRSRMMVGQIATNVGLLVRGRPAKKSRYRSRRYDPKKTRKKAPKPGDAGADDESSSSSSSDDFDDDFSDKNWNLTYEKKLEVALEWIESRANSTDGEHLWCCYLIQQELDRRAQCRRIRGNSASLFPSPPMFTAQSPEDIVQRVLAHIQIPGRKPPRAVRRLLDENLETKRKEDEAWKAELSAAATQRSALTPSAGKQKPLRLRRRKVEMDAEINDPSEHTESLERPEPADDAVLETSQELELAAVYLKTPLKRPGNYLLAKDRQHLMNLLKETSRC